LGFRFSGLCIPSHYSVAASTISQESALSRR
jgi:hypothetical protein